MLIYLVLTYPRLWGKKSRFCRTPSAFCRTNNREKNFNTSTGALSEPPSSLIDADGDESELDVDGNPRTKRFNRREVWPVCQGFWMRCISIDLDEEEHGDDYETRTPLLPLPLHRSHPLVVNPAGWWYNAECMDNNSHVVHNYWLDGIPFVLSVLITARSFNDFVSSRSFSNKEDSPIGVFEGIFVNINWTHVRSATKWLWAPYVTINIANTTLSILNPEVVVDRETSEFNWIQSCSTNRWTA